MIRVLVVDDHDTIRAVVRDLLETRAEDIKIVGECNGDAVTDTAAGTNPDVVLMGLNRDTGGTVAVRASNRAVTFPGGGSVSPRRAGPVRHSGGVPEHRPRLAGSWSRGRSAAPGQ